jgi:hypothetical protein
MRAAILLALLCISFGKEIGVASAVVVNDARFLA